MSILCGWLVDKKNNVIYGASSLDLCKLQSHGSFILYILLLRLT